MEALGNGAGAGGHTVWQKEGKTDPVQFGAFDNGKHKHKKTHICCLLLSSSIYFLGATISMAAAYQCPVVHVGEVVHSNSSVNHSSLKPYVTDACRFIESYPQYYGPPLLIFAIVGYVINCVKCSIRDFFKNKVKGSDAYAHLQQLIAGNPNLAWRATAYHNEMRTKFVLSFAHTTVMRQKVTMLDRVNTASRIAYFDYSKFGYVDKSKVACTDCNKSDSSELANMKKHAIVQLSIVKKFAFENNVVERECEHQRTEFFDKLQGIDQHLEIAQVFQIEGKTADSECLTVCADNCPFYLSTAMYWIASAVGLSWPYRILLERLTHRIEFHIQKVFGDPQVMAAAEKAAAAQHNAEDGLGDDNDYGHGNKDQSQKICTIVLLPPDADSQVSQC